MDCELQYDFLIERYKTVDELMRLEKIIKAGKRINTKNRTNEEIIELIERQFTLLDVFYDNLLSLSFEDRADFLIKHKKINVIRLIDTFDIDRKEAKRVFQYLCLGNVGKRTGYYLKIENEEEFKRILIKALTTNQMFDDLRIR